MALPKMALIFKDRPNYQTGAHEIGHTLGLEHYTRWLMAPDQSVFLRSYNIEKKEIMTIIKNAITGVTPPLAGKGTLKYTNEIMRLYHWNYRVEKRKK